LRGVRFQLNQDDNGCRGRDGRNRMHDNAQLAAVGVGWVRVEVCDLGDGKKSKEGETHNSDRRQDCPSGAAPAAKQ
jgi:hypothetical protein